MLLPEEKAGPGAGIIQQHLLSVSHPCLLNPCFLHLGCAADFNLCCTIPFNPAQAAAWSCLPAMPLELCSYVLILFMNVSNAYKKRFLCLSGGKATLVL